MRGHIVKRAKDSYTIVLNLGVDPATGKRKQQWVSVKGSKKEAEQRLSELVHQIDTGTFVKPGKATLSEFLEKWLKEYVYPNLAPRTAEVYEYIILRHLIPSLGHLTLTRIKPEHLQKYYAEKLASGRCDGKGGLSPHSVRHHHVTLHDALQTAVKWGNIGRNPADAVAPPRFQRPEMHIMNDNDIHTFLESVKGTTYYSIFYLALYTGLRRSELLALKWSDVDLLLCQVSINRSLHRLKDESSIFKAPKTSKGRRTIALTPSTVSMLREHKKNQELAKKMLDLALKDDDLVFSRISGEPLVPDTVTQVWIKTRKKLGLDNIRLHDARHSHASLMLKQGVHPKIVQKRLGHSSIQITLDTYSHVVPGLQEAAAVKFDELLNQVDQDSADTSVSKSLAK